MLTRDRPKRLLPVHFGGYKLCWDNSSSILHIDKQLTDSELHNPPNIPRRFLLELEDMSTPHQVRPTSLLSPQFINGVYIPSALLLVGCAIVKIDLLPFAIAVVLGLGGWKIYAASE